MADKAFAEFRAARSKKRFNQYLAIGLSSYFISALLTMAVGVLLIMLTPYEFLASILLGAAIGVSLIIGGLIVLAKAGFDWLSDYIAYKSSDSQDQVSDKTIGNTYINTITPNLTKPSQSQNPHQNENKTIFERFNNYVKDSWIGRNFFAPLAGVSETQIKNSIKKSKNQVDEILTI